ncbi:YggT family protein [Candidatus Daviesbacteria bacterium]|nr:YggT family protein [Candidatus Daviesbacteria bacterium]
MAWDIRSTATRLVNLVLLVVVAFLGARIVLRLFGANPATPLVSWINIISDTLVYPFSGIFPNLSLQGNSILDTVAVVALLAYLLVGYLLMAIIDSLTAGRTRVIDEHPDKHRHVHV